MRKKVMVYAYTNFNLGDDLFIKILVERYPDTNFLLYAPSRYKDTFRGLENVSIISSDKFFNKLLNYFLRLIGSKATIQSLISKKVDADVHIGGSIFMQKGTWRNKKNTIEKRIDRPHYVLGANFGPYQEEEFYQAHYKLFQKYTDICFRDTYSYDLFKGLDNVRIADDIIFQLSTPKNIKSKSYVTISVIKPSYRENLKYYDEDYYNSMKEVITHFIEKGYGVTLMSFCEGEGDKEAIEEILHILPKRFSSHINVYSYENNIEEALTVIASSTYIIATRFHAMILGWVFKKPVFPISYSKKMNNVINDLNYQGTYINLEEIKKVNPQHVYEGMYTNSLDVSLEGTRATKHFEKLDKLLLSS